MSLGLRHTDYVKRLKAKVTTLYLSY